MKLVFVSNYFNHHQLSFCDALYELLEGSFCFLQTQPMEEERVRMGWQAEARPYVRYAQAGERRIPVDSHYAQSDGHYPQAGGTVEPVAEAATDGNPDGTPVATDWRQLLLSADVVIFGGCDDETYIQERLAAGRPIFRYNERLYKEGQWKAISPRGLLQKYKDHTRYRKAPVYFLCAGAYVPCDYHLIHAYPEKMLRFGYFPETRTYEAGQPFERKQPGSILWAARMIDWKHPELVVKTAAYLKEHLIDIPFHITMIGGGELEEEVHRLAEELGVTEEITFPGYCSPEEVRAAMETSEIYLVTSDRKEGWGAVVNEAMNSGCAVVADHMIGAAPYLIRQGENGRIYRDGCEQDLFRMVESLLRNPAECRRLGEAAQKRIATEWNAHIAAERLVQLCREMGFLPEKTEGGTHAPKKKTTVTTAPALPKLWSDGPCSPAPMIPEGQMYRRINSEQ